MDYPAGPHVATRVLKRWKREAGGWCQSDGKRESRTALKPEAGVRGQGKKWPPEVGKGWGPGSPPEPLGSAAVP